MNDQISWHYIWKKWFLLEDKDFNNRKVRLFKYNVSKHNSNCIKTWEWCKYYYNVKSLCVSDHLHGKTVRQVLAKRKFYLDLRSRSSSSTVIKQLIQDLLALGGVSFLYISYFGYGHKQRWLFRWIPRVL